jgi:type I restriction enzyme R subunit
MAKHESESVSRRKRIDPRLEAAGWKVVEFKEGKPLSAYSAHAICEYPTDNGPADYALVVDGVLLGIVEAKKVTLGPQNVLTQAERYSKGVSDSTCNFRGYRVPFLYSTNGEVVWHHDIRDELNRSRRVAAFHTPRALQEMIGRDFGAACGWFPAHPNDHPRLRHYQVKANTATEEAITQRKRQMLLAMATGTGKTFTLVNQVYRLLASGVGQRILFLVDRRALAAQAVRAFASFEPEPNKKFDKIYEVYSNRFQREDFEEDAFDPSLMPNDYLTDPQPKHAFVYVCTIQRMAINLFGREAVFSGDGDDIDDDADRLSIPMHAFDVIIADECHRGYTTAEQSVWRNVLDYFDAIKVGLTATPAAHTKAYFNDVVFRYTYAEAVAEGYLVDYDVVNIKSEARINGIFLDEGETVERVDATIGVAQLDQLEDERQFAATEIEEAVTSPDSNRKILEEVKKYAAEHEERYGRFPKTLIFAANDLPHISHADQLVEIAADIFGRGQSFVRKITGKVDRPLQAIREFRNRPNPGIVVTVELLTTGVDIPDLEYIVFLRSVKSRILFEQMLGRGTRKGEKYPDKSHFTVFDCFDGTLIEYFKKATSITSEPPEKPSRTISQVIEDIWANRDRDYNVRCLVKRLRRIEKEMAPEARDHFAAHGIPEGDIGRFAEELTARLKSNFAGTMELLRKPELQEALTDYVRRQRTFIKAIEHEDSVSSQYVVRGADGKEYKPEDYLEAFARYVEEKQDEIEAIRILLDKPRDWRPQALTELRNTLAAAPQRFTVEQLQKVHHLRYDKALVDIISMVKHAAQADQPLLTADERATRAVAKVIAGVTLTPEQTAWLERIRVHLVQNLSIDEEDFEYVPVLHDFGGFRKADQAFQGKLREMLEQLNEALAA